MFRNSASPSGTFDQGGSVREWNEAVVYDNYRGLRGGAFGSTDETLRASFRHIDFYPSAEGDNIGFRVVQVPEPGSIVLLALGGLGLMRRSSVRRGSLRH